MLKKMASRTACPCFKRLISNRLAIFSRVFEAVGVFDAVSAAAVVVAAIYWDWD